MKSRDDIALAYLDQLKYPPYPVQEEAIFAWAACDQGVLLSAPTGTGKTLVAEAAIYEALQTNRYSYYSTPLIALTDQKFLELQDTVERWGFSRERVGLVTGHRTVNPNAQIKVVVAEVLLNRLLHQEVFSFEDVTSVVMDEFHSFNEPQRGIVWELSLALLPAHVRVMLLSATIGAPNEFIQWMNRAHQRRVTLVEGRERKVPLHYHWIADELLADYIEKAAQADEPHRKTPALVFCFDREVCWATADILKGKDLFAPGQRQALLDRLEGFDFSVGSGQKLRALLARGVAVHHAGLLPRYRRVVETLFQKKLLPVCVCTETLAAGLNLPARSVVLTTLVKGPRDKKKVIEVGSAQQMFGRAGRPQFDNEGHVICLAHEDDVKIARWQEKIDAIPEDTKDPKLMTARKGLIKKKPTRRQNVTYWNPEQFTRLQTAPAAKLASRGSLTWRWLAYLLDASPQVEPVRQVIRRRLMDSSSIQAELKRLTKMLVTLHGLGVVTLDPVPPEAWVQAVKPVGVTLPTDTPDDEDSDAADADQRPAATAPATDFSSQQDVNKLLGQLKLGNVVSGPQSPPSQAGLSKKTGLAANQPFGSSDKKPEAASIEPYEPITATPTAKLKEMMVFKAVQPIYGHFLMDYLGLADRQELVQILESLLEIPGSVAKALRVPKPEDMPPGPLSVDIIDPAILTSGIASQEDLYPTSDQSHLPPELRKYPIPLAQKVRMLFESRIDHAGGLSVNPVWAVGSFLEMGSSFNDFIRNKDLLKQEGIVFKHFLRMILLCEEFAQLTPAGISREAWKASMDELSRTLTEACRSVDPICTDEMLEELAEGP